MHVTERGRVVYNRKKHRFNLRDLERIQLALAEDEGTDTIWTAIKHTFQAIWQKITMDLPTAIEEVDTIMNLIVLLIDSGATFMLMKTSAISGDVYATTVDRPVFRKLVARLVREYADTIEGS